MTDETPKPEPTPVWLTPELNATLLVKAHDASGCRLCDGKSHTGEVLGTHEGRHLIRIVCGDCRTPTRYVV